MKTFAGFLWLTLVGHLLWSTACVGGDFVNFESPHAHSIALSDDHSLLFVVNTPANSLSVYSIDNPRKPTLVSEIAVGLEPVSVAVRNDNEVWVVNHVSDSISVIDLPRAVVVATVQVGDRPGDLVFAGNPPQAFVSSMTERSVYVVEPIRLQVASILPIPGNDPRTLLASRDGNSVWVAIHRSGNQTAVIPRTMAPEPPLPANDVLPKAPRQGILVNTNDRQWKKVLRDSPTDEDVFEINTTDLKITRRYSTVGTILFNLAEHPATGDVWVANTEARNLVRFEPELRGHVVDNNVTLLSRQDEASVRVMDLNHGLDYRLLPNKPALASALAQPTDVIFNQSGSLAYVTSFGTDRIGVLNQEGKVLKRIELGDGDPAEADPRNKRGPRALALHPSQNWLYVINRLSNSLSVIDVSQSKMITEILMTDPTPAEIREGRGYLFDAKLSGNGTVSCASCHVDADRDGLAWDLGDPGGDLFNNGSATPLHPMKGPLLTQTLRGLAGERIFHWRADRPGLTSFNGTFPNLMGGNKLADIDMELFADYMKSIRFHSNPLAETAQSQQGEHLFNTKLAIAREGKNKFRCIDCHKRSGGAGSTGFTGLIKQPTKAAQLRGLNERLVFDGPIKVNSFGFGADGASASLSTFLTNSHRFEKMAVEDRQALEDFLIRFPTETPNVVGKTITVTPKHAAGQEVVQKIQSLIRDATSESCRVRISGLLGERTIRMGYDSERQMFDFEPDSSQSLSLASLLEQLAEDQTGVLSFIAVP